MSQAFLLAPHWEKNVFYVHSGFCHGSPTWQMDVNLRVAPSARQLGCPPCLTPHLSQTSHFSIWEAFAPEKNKTEVMMGWSWSQHCPARLPSLLDTSFESNITSITSIWETFAPEKNKTELEPTLSQLSSKDTHHSTKTKT